MSESVSQSVSPSVRAKQILATEWAYTLFFRTGKSHLCSKVFGIKAIFRIFKFAVKIRLNLLVFLTQMNMDFCSYICFDKVISEVKGLKGVIGGT